MVTLDCEERGWFDAALTRARDERDLVVEGARIPAAHNPMLEQPLAPAETFATLLRSTDRTVTTPEDRKEQP